MMKHHTCIPASRLRRAARRGGCTRLRSFTLTELLAAIAIIVVSAGVTVVSVSNIAREARLSSAVNTVSAALDTGRALAIRDNRITVVAFRPRLDGNRQFTEIVIAQWTGEASSVLVSGDVRVIDRFVPVAGVANRRLPRGIQVAAPRFRLTIDPDIEDDLWTTQSNLPRVAAGAELAGELVAVMYDPSGTVITRNVAVDSDRSFIDFNNNGRLDFPSQGESFELTLGTNINWQLYSDLWWHQHERDEAFLNFAPYLAVYDDDAARDAGDPTTWSNLDEYRAELTGPGGYITENGERIHFNRYTGVVMR